MTEGEGRNQITHKRGGRKVFWTVGRHHALLPNVTNRRGNRKGETAFLRQKRPRRWRRGTVDTVTRKEAGIRTKRGVSAGKGEALSQEEKTKKLPDKESAGGGC